MRKRLSTRALTVLALAVAVGMAAAGSPFASADPDGLEKVAEKKAFLDDGKLASLQEDSPLPDYAFPGIEDERVATGVAGFTGTLGVFALGYGLAVALGRRRSAGGDPGGRAPAAT